MILQHPFGALASEVVYARIIPDVCPIAPKASELDVVEVAVFAVSEHKDEFMPGTVE